MKKLKVAAVRWFDSAVPKDQGMWDLDDITDLEPIKMVDIGIVVREDKDKILLAGEMSHQGLLRRIIVIPKVNVISIKRWDL